VACCQAAGKCIDALLKAVRPLDPKEGAEARSSVCARKGGGTQVAIRFKDQYRLWAQHACGVLVED